MVDDVYWLNMYGERILVVVGWVISLLDGFGIVCFVGWLDVYFDVYWCLGVVCFIYGICKVECVDDFIVDVLFGVIWCLFNCVVVECVLVISYRVILVMIVGCGVVFVEVVVLDLVCVVVELFLIEFI